MSSLGRVLICIAACLWATASQGATIELEAISPDLTLVHVTGDFEFGDQKKFIDTVLPLRRAVVVLESHGGSLDAGLEIGKAIRLKGFGTFVGDGALCASACGLAWLAGNPRIMTTSARVGFHAASDERRNITSVGNALIGSYLNHLGLPTAAVVYITRPDLGDMAWLTFEDARRHQIDVRHFDETQQPQTAAAPPAPTPAPPPRGAGPAPAERPALPPEAYRSDLRTRTHYFIQNHFSAMSSNNNNEAAIDYVRSVYGGSVDYSGEIKSRAQVVITNVIFIERWPSRR